MKNVIKTLVEAVKEFFVITHKATRIAQSYKRQQDVAKVKKALLEA